MQNYLFTSSRLGFRNWTKEDENVMAAINSNKSAMQYFPELQSLQQTQDFVARQQLQFLEKGYCYFAIETLETQQFIGFIGISFQNFEASFTPCVDIGWRLHPNFWHQGLATEGAEACVKYAFEILKIEKIFSIAPKLNTPSINVMKKIGMQFLQEFKHPKLSEYPELENCVVYLMEK
jgi:RimJ/RimL family protein N-acetyltransferase